MVKFTAVGKCAPFNLPFSMFDWMNVGFVGLIAMRNPFFGMARYNSNTMRCHSPWNFILALLSKHVEYVYSTPSI
jgi:hypothetical protein